MTRIFAEKLTANADLKTILETVAREAAEATQADSCRICLNNSLGQETIVCEYRAAENAETDVHKVVLPLAGLGKLLGSVTIAVSRQLDLDETGRLSAAFAELGTRIHHAQIADIVQRQTFHKTFLTEIDNVMTYSTGIGDALFVIVNILGKVLRVSRCIFVCTDNAETGWKSYEYWVQDQVQSCKSYNWPATDSPLVARTLLADRPVTVYAAARGSFLTPVQQELQSIDVQSFMGIPLKTEKGVHGCVMIQQCDFCRQWKHADINMLQAAADTVGKGLLKLPAEKFTREPIMQLHQRSIDTYKDKEAGKKKVEAVRRALKGGGTAGGAGVQQAVTVAEAAGPVVQAVEPTVQTKPDVQQAESAVEVAPPVQQAALPAETENAKAAKEAEKGDKKSKPAGSRIKRSETKLQEEAALKKHSHDKPAAKSQPEPATILSKEDQEYIFATPGLDTRTLNRIAGWVNQIESNDKYANGHAVPVAKYATAAAQQLGLPAHEVNAVRLAALVHDVGKMSTAAYILKKEDEDLSDAELLISMKHPQEGAELLESFPDLAHIAAIVHAHHEEYDGNGYPLGLKGEDIPLAARILFTANSYHMMISPRKSEFTPISPKVAQENLRNGAGSQYDPRVVEALLRGIKQMEVGTPL